MITTIYKGYQYKILGNKVLVCINRRFENEVELCDELMIPCYNRDVIISGLIKANYPSDIMDAVRNNYELVRDGTAGDKTQEYTQEYNKMQDWRRYCKELAAEIMTN